MTRMNNQLGNLPEEIGQLSSLTSLDLQNNPRTILSYGLYKLEGLHIRI